MKTCITVRYNYLKAAQKLAASQDIRYYLNGVLLEITPEETRYVATDGHGLLVLRDRTGGPACEIIVPHETINMLPRTTRSPQIGPELHYDPEFPNGECRLGDVMFLPTAGKFPEYRKIIPETVSKVWASIQVAYMLRYHEAAEIAHGRGQMIEFWPNGPDGVCLVTCGHNDFTGAVMPFKAHENTPQFAQWAKREPVAA